ncbi:hypothetical protein QZH41_007664 [Actinostola sp. cb2023]|nr:hypothetical protein QZH41_007664 [Actinostola sp. cb2023]
MPDYTKPSPQSSIKVIFVIVSGIVCCGEFLRIELILKDQYTRIHELENKITSTLKTNVMKTTYVPHGRPKSREKETKRVQRSLVGKETSKTNTTKHGSLEDRLSKLEESQAIVFRAKYFVAIPGPPGKRGKMGPIGPGGKSGKRGKMGPIGPMGAPGNRGKPGGQGQIGPQGPRGKPGKQGPAGPKGDLGLALAAPSLIISPLHLIVNKTKTAIFHCSASGNPRPVIGWSKVGGSLAINRSIVDSSGKLEIKHVTSRDTGIYHCKASNILGKAQTTATLEVHFRPRVTLDKGPLYRGLRKNVTLPACHVTGHPKPKITWSKLIGELSRDRTVINDGQLTLLNSRQEDSGSYFCKAENPLGSVTAVTMVVFFNIPEFIVKPNPSYNVTAGSNITLPCVAKGDPQPIIHWVKNNGNLPAARHNVKDGTLVLRKTVQSDTGIYMCIVTGGFTVKTTTSLHVITVEKDCSELYKSGERRNGVYTIKPDSQEPFEVYCDMTTDGGGWTVFQRRQDGSVTFDRVWQEYKTGFGNLTGEFWLGNEYIHRLTSRNGSTLRIDLEDSLGFQAFAKYDHFEVDSELYYYRVKRMEKYSGTAGNYLQIAGFGRIVNNPFITKDHRDHVTGGGWANDVYFLHNYSPLYKSHGCYRDTLQRAMGSYQGARRNRNDSIGMCYDDAVTNGYTMFGLQYGGECWSGDKIEMTYSKYGEAGNCKDGLGGGWANDVYSIIKAKGLKVFGVQYDGECYSSPNGESVYKKYGAGTGCANGVGESWLNDVYYVNSTSLYTSLGCWKDEAWRRFELLGTWREDSYLKCYEATL